MKEFSGDLERLKRRDPDAVGEFVLAHHRQIRGYIASLSMDYEMVDDLSQEVFVRALNQLKQARDLSNFGAFMRGIARNVVHEFQQQKKRPVEKYARFVEAVYAGEEEGRSPSVTGSPEAVKALRTCIEKLPDRSRKLLALRYFEEKQTEQIAKGMGLNGSAVRMALLRIREGLLKCIRTLTGCSATEAGL